MLFVLSACKISLLLSSASDSATSWLAFR